MSLPTSTGVARFAFEDLCNQPLGPADYVAVSRRYHTIFIKDIPRLCINTKDQARRFITLVDELYNHKCGLVCTAETSPDALLAEMVDYVPMDMVRVTPRHGHETVMAIRILHMVILIVILAGRIQESLQFETETEINRSRRNLQDTTTVAPIGSSSKVRSYTKANVLLSVL